MMPTRDEILKDLLAQLRELRLDHQNLTKRVEDLERDGLGDGWDKPFDPGEREFQAEPNTVPQQELDHVPERLRPAAQAVAPNWRQAETGAEDPDEDTPEVVEAKARIEEANRADLQPRLHVKEVKVTPGPKDSIMVTVPAATKQQEFMRKATAPRVIANLPGLDHDVAKTAYVKGGPIWLHAFDRKHVIGLPSDLRQQFIKDVAMTAPEQAQELAADILKITDPETQSMWAHANMEGVKAESEWRNG